MGEADEAAKLIAVPASVVGMSPRADRSWKLQFETRELAGEEVKILADNYQGEGWLLYKPNGDITPAEVPTDEANSGVKTQSQRLRDVVYILWKQKGGKTDFEGFRRLYYEKLIELTKSKLEED